MKKFLLFALAIGLLTPIFVQVREFYYLSVLIVFVLLFLSIKKRAVSLIDFLIIFLITIPLHSFRFGGTEHFVRLSEIAFAPLFLMWVISRFLNRSREPVVVRKEFLLLGIYLLINIASVKNSIYPAISIKRVLILAYLFLFTYIVSDIVNKKEKITTVVKAMIWISAISSIVAAIQCVFPQALMFVQVPIGTAFGITFYRASVGWIDPNYYGLYLAMNSSITLSLLLSPYGKRHRFLKMCFPLQIIGILATFSRTVMICMILVSLYLLSYYGRKKMALSLFLLFMATVATISASRPIIYEKHPFVASFVYRLDEEEIKRQPTLIMGHRYAAFRANWSMFLDHPILGVGPFMAMYNFGKYRPFGYSYPLEWLASHNQYLQLLSEKGIFGFIVFLGFMFTIIKSINALLKKIPNSEYKVYLIGFKAAILIYLIAGLALETSHEVQFWLTAGLSIAFLNIFHSDEIMMLQGEAAKP